MRRYESATLILFLVLALPVHSMYQACSGRCALGYYSLYCIYSCAPCSQGKFNENGGGQCYGCPKGKYNEFAGMSYCLDCPAGTYYSWNTALQNPCVPCDAGKFSDSSEGCLDCEYGHFAPQPGSTACLQCPPGKYQDEKGSQSCTHCSPETISWENASISCESCPPGTIVNSEGQSSCSTCAAGKYAASPTMCESCDYGKFSLADIIGCRDCEPGYFSDTREQLLARIAV